MLIAQIIFSVTLISPAACLENSWKRPHLECLGSIGNWLTSPRRSGGARFQNQSEDRININVASALELERLPGIGPALASRIVEHRRKHGPFKRPQDVIIVRGMSAKLYRRIAHLIRA
ncbi:MAG: ComEA family DNA-binding protein [Blastocatellales bacterium]